MRPLTAHLLLLACAVIWGMSFLFQKAAMAHVAPLQFVAARCALAALVLAPLVWREHVAGHRAAPPAHLLRIIPAAGAILFVAAALQQRGIVSATVTNTAFLTTLYVVATPLLAWPLLRQKPGARIWAAVALCLLGAWLLGGGGPTAFGAGEIDVIAATGFWAAHVIALALAARHGRPVLLTAAHFAVAAALALAGALAFETIDATALRAAAREIVFVGILSSAVTFTIFAAALRGTSPAAAMIVAAAEAPIAAVAAHMVLGERMTATGATGAALMLAAVVVAQRAAPHKS